MVGTAGTEFAVVGVVEQSNAAILVTVSSKVELLDRRRVLLTGPDLPTHPHHHQGSWALGRYLNTPGAHRLSMDEAVGLVRQVEEAARAGASSALHELADSVKVPIAAVAVRRIPEMPRGIEARIVDHRVQAFADSAMYRHAVVDAARGRGWQVTWYDRESAIDRADEAVAGELALVLDAFGRTCGPPWQAAHKLAAAAAIAAITQLRPAGDSAGDKVHP